MNTAATQTQIKTFITQDLGLDLDNVGDSDPLFTSGLIDSFALIELLAFLEGTLNVAIDIADLNIEELDSVDSLVKLVESSK